MNTKFFYCIIFCSILFQNIAIAITTSIPYIIENLDLKHPSHDFGKQSITIEDYNTRRAKFFENEKNRSLGADELLNSKEECINKIIMELKEQELNDAFLYPDQFLGGIHFFNALNRINNDSKLFKIIEKMPKGAILHAHDTAMISSDYLLDKIIFSEDYKDILWYLDSENDIEFKISHSKPSNLCWLPIGEALKIGGNYLQKLRNKIRNAISLMTDDPLNQYKDINVVWKRFQKTFMTIDPIVTYEPIWRQYFRQCLQEMLNDNVQYLEFRGLLPTLFDLTNKTYGYLDTLKVYYDVVEEFKKANPNFIGVKFIYGPNRNVDIGQFENYVKIIIDIKEKYPDFVAGFDLVSQEDKGRPLKYFIQPLLDLKNNHPEIEFFFHAGETNWNGLFSDENIIDAILLETKRIGHGYSILKHPHVMEEIKTKKITIEVNPISNQVLKLVSDNRNHPCTYLFADNYPVIISSDDPSFWDAKPLSHDFYIAFMGLASAHSDLKLLKKLARNSIEYSSMNYNEKIIAIEKWENEWENFINHLDKQC